MGYTHYWKHRVDCLGSRRWEGFAEEVDWMLRGFTDGPKGIPFYCGLQSVDDDPPIVDQDRVIFNGLGDDAHETFVFEKGTDSVRIQPYKTVETDPWNYCKTQNKPYDTYVVKTLLLASKYFGEGILLESDGDVFNDIGESMRTYGVKYKPEDLYCLSRDEWIRGAKRVPTELLSKSQSHAFFYLDNLRDSMAVNMWEAAPLLMRDFEHHSDSWEESWGGIMQRDRICELHMEWIKWGQNIRVKEYQLEKEDNIHV